MIRSGKGILHRGGVNPSEWTEQGQWIDLKKGTLGGDMAVRQHRRYSTEFKLRLVEAYLGGEGSAKGLASQHGISHSRLLIWTEKYRKGELTLDMQAEDGIQG